MTDREEREGGRGRERGREGGGEREREGWSVKACGCKYHLLTCYVQQCCK